MKNSATGSAFSLAPILILVVGTACAGTAPFSASRDITDLKPHTGLPPFEYMEAAGGLPNYQPGGDRARPGRITQMPKPLSPEESAKHLVTLPGFEAKLFAAEPQINKPICMAWDERGRLWIAETVDYPNNMQPPGQGHDRIVICEDTDGDGKADKFTVFADKLSIPTSIVFANGGILVQQAPNTLFLKDTDGDDKADVRQVLFSGWGIYDTHAGPNNLRWGFDNWIWGMVGYSGFDGIVGGESHKFQMGFYRFRPDGSKLEFIRSSNNNTWGIGWSEDAVLFGSTANNNPSMYMPIPNRYYESVNGWSASRLESIADSAMYYPVTDKIRQVDVHGGYTAAAGHALYTARSYPKEYWNRVAFVAEPTGHLVGKFVLQADGADFAAHNAHSFLASDDEWTAPIMAEVGPDGSVWVIDWYNYVVQHNPTPAGFSTGRGNAYETPVRDKVHGRIYRIVYTGGHPSRQENLAKATPDQLVAALKNDNLLWRMHAQRLLVEHGYKQAMPSLFELAKNTSVDDIGLNDAAIHALWTLQGLGALDGANPAANAVAATALKHPSAGVRRAALMVMPRTVDGLNAVLNSNALADSDAQVRLAALLALADMPPAERAGQAVAAMLKEERNGDDRWISQAATSAAAHNDAAFLRAILAAVKAGAGTKPIVPANLLKNASFESEADGKPLEWVSHPYAGQARFSLSDVSHDGGRSVRIESSEGADASWQARVNLTPHTEYTLSAWVKTEKINGATGALLNIHELSGVRTKAVKGTANWTKVETTFNSGDYGTATINCLYGGWGRSTGTAWYDDVQLTAAASDGLPGASGRVLQVVMRHYAARVPVESVVPTLLSLNGVAASVAMPVVEGLAAGWPQGTAPQVSPADAQSLLALLHSLPNEVRAPLVRLAARWGRPDLFGAEVANVTKILITKIADGNLKITDRVDAAREAMALSDAPATVQAVLAALNPLNPPELAAGLIGSLGESRADETAAALVEKYPQLSPASRRAAMSVLLRRPSWALALLNAVDAGKLRRTDLSVEHWQQLRTHPDRKVAARARQLQGTEAVATSKELEALVQKLMPVTTATGDAAAGKKIFEANCMVCHTLNGVGGKVGPELTGFGAHPKNEILIAVVDPNRSVEANFRMWTVTTKGGDTFAGRLDSESQNAVDIFDTTGQKHTIQRKEIEKLEASNLSLMPEGFGGLPPQDLQNLLEYISQSKVAKK